MGLCRGDFNRPILHASFFVFSGGQGRPLLQKIFLIQIILNLSNSAKKISKGNKIKMEVIKEQIIQKNKYNEGGNIN